MDKVSSSPWKNEQWYVSLYNGQVDSLMPEEVLISDCTLREGEQQAGVVLSRKEKIHVAHLLDDIGIPQLELGMPAVSEEEEGKRIARQHPALKQKMKWVKGCPPLEWWRKQTLDKEMRAKGWIK